MYENILYITFCKVLNHVLYIHYVSNYTDWSFPKPYWQILNYIEQEKAMYFQYWCQLLGIKSKTQKVR